MKRTFHENFLIPQTKGVTGFRCPRRLRDGTIKVVVADQAQPARGNQAPRAGRNDRERVNATARAVVESAADAIVAFSTDRTVMLWNPAAERMFGWAADEVIGLEPPIIPEEHAAEHNAVFERVRGGGQVSFATR